MISRLFQQIPIVVVILLLLVSAPSLFSQNRKTEKLLQKAEAKFNLKKFVEAEQLYESIIQTEPNNYEAAYRLGVINDNLEDYNEALRWYQTAAEIDPERNDTVFYYIGLTHKRLNNYRQAKEVLLEFQERHQTQDEYYQRAQLEIEGAELAEASQGKRPKYSVNNVSFNSDALDAFPTMLDQRQEDKFIVFTSHRRSKGRSNKRYQGLGQPAFSDLFSVVIENDSVYGPPVNLGTPLNTKMNDGTATFSGDGLSVFYTICNDKKNKYGCSIYESRYDPLKKTWGRPEIVSGLSDYRDIVINSRGKTKRVPTDDRQPSLTRDGRTLFFASNRGGGQGGFDIWYSRRQGTGWSKPENAGPVINTPFDELTPYISEDANKLYFSSNGRGGFGGFDLYKSEGSIDAWTSPNNLGAPINTSFDEISILTMDNDSLILFSSNKPGGFGSYDIYWSREIYYPPGSLNIAVQGLIRDKRTKQPIPFATAILYEYVAGGAILPIDTFQTDQSARYYFPLIKDKNYKVLGNAPEYLANEEEVSTMGIDDDTDIEQNIDIELEPIVINEPIVLQNIYYDFDEFYLRPDALLELNRLVKILRQNANITIQLGSHTDTNGTLKYNDVLSNNRAKAAIKYLADNGINPNRLSWLGFGELKPLIYPELTDEDEQANRRTEFRITSIDFDE